MFKGIAAIGRIPVVSADGRCLMPCKPKKALSLVNFGKALWKRGEDGALYLKFNPRPPIAHPKAVVQPKSDLSPSSLVEVKRVAKRKRVWFRLPKIERGILDLTIKYIKEPRSPRLIDLLRNIVEKIKASLVSPLQRLMEEVGKPLAEKISSIAKSWGNKEAGNWAKDKGFIMYLTVTSEQFQRVARKRV
ncbi:MAG: hypothetical protein ACUVQ5_06110 [Candidatus Methanomethylicaceae archaeon]